MCFQPPNLLIGKVWVPVMHFFMSDTLQSSLESGQEVRIMQINFSAAFDRVDHQEILYKFCSVCIGGYLLSILTQFLSNHSQHFMVDDCRSKLVHVVSGVPQGSALGPLLFLLCALEIFSNLVNKLIGYAADHEVSGASILTAGVFECNLAHRRSVSVLCMLYNIRCKPMHPLFDALPVPYVPVRVTRGAVIVHRYT